MQILQKETGCTYQKYNNISDILNSYDNYPAEIKRLSLSSVLKCLGSL